MQPKPRMCNCTQCRGYRDNKHKQNQGFRKFQKKQFNKKLRRYFKIHGKHGDFELPNYGSFILYHTD